jgi:hypothetical protein
LFNIKVRKPPIVLFTPNLATQVRIIVCVCISLKRLWLWLNFNSKCFCRCWFIIWIPYCTHLVNLYAVEEQTRNYSNFPARGIFKNPMEYTLIICYNCMETEVLKPNFLTIGGKYYWRSVCCVKHTIEYFALAVQFASFNSNLDKRMEAVA